ncbi:MAG: peptidase M61 [Bacteroidota bacterium]
MPVKSVSLLYIFENSMKNPVKTKYILTLMLCFLLYDIPVFAQENYRYSIDLTRISNDRLLVTLLAPHISLTEVKFYLPKIVPGTYMNSNYGKYIHSLKATDKNGRKLPVTKYDVNGWTIKKSDKLYKLTYEVEDTWDSKINNVVYSMAGTSFEAGKNFVLNTPGLFGYFDGMKNLPFELNFVKPAGFYATTGLVPTLSNSVNDVFICRNADFLYDSPLMYCVPDTATIKVGTTDVLIGVYSPRKKATATFIAQNIRQFLERANAYLGGKMPVDKYAFIFYFNGEQAKLETPGAWEHSYSSFYSMDETPEKESIANWIDIAAHEFFHIVTPLTISSKEVKQFNFNETILSKHLWLYEGSTEYYAQNMQAWGGLITPEKFLENLSEKITFSRTQMKDDLSFTELSKESAGKHAGQYTNVYSKGALISTCLDLYLLQLSGGKYGIRQLKQELGLKYGADKYFDDDSLFQEITNLTYPEISNFFQTYVEGTTPIPYDLFFDIAGVEFIPSENYMDFSLGGLQFRSGPDDMVKIGVQKMNEFGKSLGYQQDDLLVSINDTLVSYSNIDARIAALFRQSKEGDMIVVKVQRKNKKGETELFNLYSPMKKVKKERINLLRFSPDPTPAQLKIRNIWLNNHSANPIYESHPENPY